MQQPAVTQIFDCKLCDKKFRTLNFLREHHYKRHPGREFRADLYLPEAPQSEKKGGAIDKQEVLEGVREEIGKKFNDEFDALRTELTKLKEMQPPAKRLEEALLEKNRAAESKN